MRNLTITACFFISSLSLNAVKTEHFKQSTFEDFSDGELSGLSLSSLGELMPAPAIEKLAEIDADSIHAAVLAEDGTLYIGTGSSGTLYKLAASEDAEPEVVLDSQEIMVSALTFGPDNALYAATSPGGRLYRIEEGKRPEVYFDPEALYLWDLLFDEEGNLYVATGSDAIIYRLPPNFMPGDEAETWFTSDKTHFNSLAFDKAGHLLAGAGPKSFLYRISGKDEGEVLFNAATDEIPQIYPADDGTVYFTTLHSESSASSYSNLSPEDLPAILEKIQSLSKASNGNGSTSNGNGTASTPAATASPSFLYKFTTDGFGEPVWSPGSKNILAILPKADGSFLIGTDDEAKLYSVIDSVHWSLLGLAESGGSISQLLQGSDGEVYVLTSNPAAAYRLNSSPAKEVIYTSEALDARAIARWGRLLPVSDERDGATIGWKTRSGNSPEPDDTWSEWQALDAMKIISPQDRYLQYEASFTTNEDKSLSPSLSELRIFYAFNNAAPIVNRINILPVGIMVLNIAAPPKPPVNLKQLTGSKELATAQPNQAQTRSQVRFTGEQGSFSFGWNASDPNRDDLTYTLKVMRVDGDSSGSWVTLASDLSESVFSINMRGFTDGHYRAQVVASDEASNPPGQSKKGSQISQIFIIDNTNPVVAIESSESTKNTIKISANDELSIIASASYSLDGKPARKLFPDDGFYDALEEDFTLTLDDTKPGNYSLLVEVIDEAGNKSTAESSIAIEP